MVVTVVEETIGSGADFETLVLWEDAIDADLTTGEGKQYVGKVIAGELTFTASALNVTGHTTAAGKNIILRAGDGDSFKDHAGVRTNALTYNASNGSAIRATSGSTFTLLNFDDDWTELRDLQVAQTTQGDTVTIGMNGADCLIDDCLLKGGAKCTTSSAGDNVDIHNTLFQAASVGSGIAVSFIASTLRGCTIVNWATGISDVEFGPACVLENCAVFNNTDDFASGTTYTGTKYTATDNASAVPGGGAGNQNGLTMSDEFESTTVDFRALDGNLDGAGLADTTNLLRDISDELRADPPTVGCWEVVAAGASLDPGVAAASSVVIAPTITLGAVTLDPGVAAATAVVIAPSITLGAVSLDPGIAAAGAVVIAPSITLGAVVLDPGIASAAAVVIAPSIDNAVALDPGIAAASAVVIAPSITLGAVSLDPGVVAAAAVVMAPPIQTLAIQPVYVFTVPAIETTFQPPAIATDFQPPAIETTFAPSKTR